MQIDGVAERLTDTHPEHAELDDPLLRRGGHRFTVVLLTVAGIAWIAFVVLLVLFVRSS
jgi:hypothetical protein